MEYRVVEGGELGRDLFVGHNYEQAARIRAEDYVQRITGRLTTRGLDAQGVARVGNPAHEIVNCARETQVDLIVMSTECRTGPARAILGSVADQVVQHADVAVLLVPWKDSARRSIHH
jgi:nucleotide-binding universal stress UspA family protein